jgi:hypothetical protein
VRALRSGAAIDPTTCRRRFRHASALRARAGLPVSLIAVDHYDLGDLLDSVEKLNRERIRAARRRATE